jgi:hypothetical protein
VGCAALGRDARPSQRRAFDHLVHALRRAQSACEAARASAAGSDWMSPCSGGPRGGTSSGGH